MNVKDYDYFLPEELVADKPLARGDSRLMVLNREEKRITHSGFNKLIDFIDENTTIVFNASKVIPARLFGKRESGGKVEFLLIKETDDGLWEAMGKSSKRLRDGEKILLDGGMQLSVNGKIADIYLLRFSVDKQELYEYLNQFGDIPLPPYILKKRGEKRGREEDKKLYQTIYADIPGSVAAPTAGLHFNEKLIEKLSEKTNGRIEYIFLHVGLGTFLPVKTDIITEHKMHSEEYYIPEDVAMRLNRDKKNGRKILAIGTTTVRALETATGEDGLLKSGSSESRIFIYPGYDFKFVDRITTNFHLPKSTLIMMISAFAGRDFIMEAYREAVDESYRFYSYGDGMLIL